jgi:P27 family predicted phage terminase small subunit
MVTALDRAALAAYAQAWGRWVQAETALAALPDPFTCTTAAGNLIQTPLLGACNRAAADMMRYAAECGLTPASRGKVQPLPVETPDPSDRFFNR